MVICQNLNQAKGKTSQSEKASYKQQLMQNGP